MLPSAYEFHWDTGHLVFLGIFYGVVTVVLTGLGCAAYQWMKDLHRKRVGAIEWEEAFHDLPEARRHCRHEFDGTFDRRICNNGFDCAHCTGHREIAADTGNSATQDNTRLFHRGHTWVHLDHEGVATIGLDGFARSCFGKSDRMAIPPTGEDLVAGERCLALERGYLRARIPSPLSGSVVEQGMPGDNWLFRLRPTGEPGEIENLLQGREAEVWLLREKEWLQKTLHSAEGIPMLADGGDLIDDLVEAYPRADWEDIWAQVCLEA